MRKKSLFQYAVLLLFIMSMGLSFMEGLHAFSLLDTHTYLGQGLWLLSCVLFFSLFFGLVRAEDHLASHLPPMVKRILELAIISIVMILGLFLRASLLHDLPEVTSPGYSYDIAVHLLGDSLLSRDATIARQYLTQFPSAMGYPMLILSPLMGLFGQSIWVVHYSNLMFSILSLLLFYFIAKRFVGRFIAMLCLSLLCCWPSQFLLSRYASSEQIFTLLILLGCFLAFTAMARDEHSLYARKPNVPILFLILAGIIFGFAHCIKPIAFYLIVALFIAMVGINRVAKSHTERASYQVLGRGWMCGIILVLFFLLTSTILTQRANELIGEETASGLNATGYHVMVGVNVSAQGEPNSEDQAYFESVYKLTGSASKAHESCWKVAWERIEKEPLAVMNLLISQFCELWKNDDFGTELMAQYEQNDILLSPSFSHWLQNIRNIGQCLYMAMILLCFLGGLQLVRSRLQTPILPLTCILFFLFTSFTYVFFGTPSLYHYSMTPFLLLTGAWTLSSWRKGLIESPPERIVQVILPPEQLEESDDHTRFDIGKAIREGHIIVTTTKAYEPADHTSIIEPKNPSQMPVSTIDAPVVSPPLQRARRSKRIQKNWSIFPKYMSKDIPTLTDAQAQFANNTIAKRQRSRSERPKEAAHEKKTL